MNLGWPYLFYIKVKFGHIGFCMGKSENYLFIFFLETLAALSLKVAWSIQLNELMKLSEYQRSRSFFDVGQRSLRFQSKCLTLACILRWAIQGHGPSCFSFILFFLNKKYIKMNRIKENSFLKIIWPKLIRGCSWCKYKHFSAGWELINDVANQKKKWKGDISTVNCIFLNKENGAVYK